MRKFVLAGRQNQHSHLPSALPGTCGGRAILCDCASPPMSHSDLATTAAGNAKMFCGVQVLFRHGG